MEPEPFWPAEPDPAEPDWVPVDPVMEPVLAPDPLFPAAPPAAPPAALPPAAPPPAPPPADCARTGNAAIAVIVATVANKFRIVSSLLTSIAVRDVCEWK
jgi:hypothetical protein